MRINYASRPSLLRLLPMIAFAASFLLCSGEKPRYHPLGHGFYWYTTQEPFAHAPSATKSTSPKRDTRWWHTALPKSSLAIRRPCADQGREGGMSRGVVAAHRRAFADFSTRTPRDWSTRAITQSTSIPGSRYFFFPSPAFTTLFETASTEDRRRTASLPAKSPSSRQPSSWADTQGPSADSSRPPDFIVDITLTAAASNHFW